MITLLRRWYERHFSQPGTIEFALVLTVSFIIVYYFMWLVGPMVVALCLAFCLDWPVEIMKRRFAISRRLGSIIVMFVFSSLLISATLLLVPNVIKQGAEFYNSVVSFSTDDSAGAPLPDAPPESLSGAVPGASASSEITVPHSEDGRAVDGTALGISPAASEAGISAAAGYRSGSSSLGAAAEAFAHIASGGVGSAAPARGKALDQAAGPAGSSVLGSSADLNLSPEGAQALAEAVGTGAGAAAGAAGSAGGAMGAAPGAEAALDGPVFFNAPEGGRKSETTIVYITGPGTDGHASDPQSKEKMAQAVASAALAAAEMEQARRDGGARAAGSTVPHNGETAAHTGDTEGYKITLINGSGEHFNFNSNENEFTLSVNDFDARLAKELHNIVLNLPDPLPGMLTQSLLEDSVRNARVAATNKMADLMRTQLMPSVVNAFTWLVYAIIVPIFTFLMLYNKEQLQVRALTFILPNNQQLMRKFWPGMHRQIGGYIRGKLLHIIIIAIANTLAFMVLDINYALLLGVGVGLSVVIPYVGAVIIAIPVVMVAIFQFGFSSDLIWVLVIYTVIQLLDSNVLTPMLFSKAMNLDAFSILAAILIFGNLWGFWGVFFAIPLATFVKTLIVEWPNAEPFNHKGERI